MITISAETGMLALLAVGNLCGELSLRWRVSVEGKEAVIVARKRTAVPQGVMAIELLQRGSTKDRPVLELAMLPCLKDAIARLVKDGDEFATPLRLEWENQEVLVWSRQGCP